MKICFLGNARSSIIRSWARHFANLGHEVHLISSEPGPTEDQEIEEVSLHRIGNEWRLRVITFIIMVLQIKSILKKLKPDVVHAHYVYGYGLLVALSGYHPFVATSMGNDIGVSPEKSWLLRNGTKYVLKKADIIAVKDKFAEVRAIELGCAEDKIIIAHSNCDTQLFTPEARSERLREQLGIAAVPSVLLTRPMNNEYRVEVFVKAIPQVIKSIPNIKFIITERGADWEKWKEYMTQKGWSKNFIFIPKIPHDEMREYLASVDALVDTFYPEFDVGGHGHGTNTIEAMSCGCPQILPDRREYTESWCQAILYPKGNSEGLAKAIVSLFSDDVRRLELGKKSRASALEYGDENKVMGDMFEIYQRLQK